MTGIVQQRAGYPPSSPYTAIVRDGRVIHMAERHHIERQSAYDKYCCDEADASVEIFDPVATLQISQQEARERLGADRDIAVGTYREDWEISTGKIEGAIEVDPDVRRDPSDD